MKKILLCVAALFATSCASTSSKQKLSDDECLIIIRSGTNRENPGARIGMNYSIHVSEIDKRFNIPSTADQYIYFKINNDHTKIDKLIGTIAAGFTGSPFKQDLDVMLPYTAGKVIPMNFSIINEVRKVGSSSYTGYIEFYKLNKEEVNILLAEVKNNPDFESWF